SPCPRAGCCGAGRRRASVPPAWSGPGPDPGRASPRPPDHAPPTAPPHPAPRLSHPAPRTSHVPHRPTTTEPPDGTEGRPPMTTTLPAAPPPLMGKAAVAALGLLALSTGALESVVAPTIPLLERELGMSPSASALLGVVLLVTGALVTPLAGKFGDRYGGKTVM